MCLLVWLGVEQWRAGLPSEPERLPVSALLSALDLLPGPLHQAQFAEKVQGPILVDALDSAGWVSVGLTPKQAASAMRYRDAVGGFVDRAVLERMRVLPDGWVERHAHQLAFPVRRESGARHHETASGSTPDVHPPSSTGGGRRAIPPKEPVDLNKADSLTLVAMKGVGPWVAAKVLKARREWGGFADAHLLEEALGWDSLAHALMPRFTAHPKDVVGRCPDSLTAEEWRTLPGVGWRQAEVLQRYTALHGASDSALSRCLGVDSATVKRLAPYLSPCGEGRGDRGDL